MPSKRPLLLILIDMRDAIGHAQDFTAGLTFEEFQNSPRTRLATQRALEMVAEATTKLPDEFKQRYPDIPWQIMKDTGNFYRHEYHDVLDHMTLGTVRDFLPSVLAIVEAELGAITPTSPGEAWTLGRSDAAPDQSAAEAPNIDRDDDLGL